MIDILTPQDTHNGDSDIASNGEQQSNRKNGERGQRGRKDKIKTKKEKS